MCLYLVITCIQGFLVLVKKAGQGFSFTVTIELLLPLNKVFDIFLTCFLHIFGNFGGFCILQIQSIQEVYGGRVVRS